MRHPPARPGSRGVTLPELLIVLTLLGTLAGLAFGALREFREGATVRAAARAVRGHLTLARSMAVARRETLRLRVDASGDLVVLDAAGERRVSATIGRGSELDVDSIRLRPRTLRFNARGQAAPGSVYLYRGDRRVRIVSNFLGRLRVESDRIR